jgi:hypothetical protein
MRNLILGLAVMLVFISCKTSNYPSIESSKASITADSARIAKADEMINKRSIEKKDKDLIAKIPVSTFNKISKRFYSASESDLKFTFLDTKNVIKEDKKVLGIEYTNHLDIDGGGVRVDFSNFSFDKFYSNKLYSSIELKGNGKITVSGHYTGIAASMTPEINLYMNEKIAFSLSANNAGYLTLTPDPARLNLRTKFEVTLLRWQVPYNHNVPIELTSLLKPINIPLMFGGDVKLPLPTDKQSKTGFETVDYNIRLEKPEVSATEYGLDYSAEIKLVPK